MDQFPLESNTNKYTFANILYQKMAETSQQVNVERPASIPTPRIFPHYDSGNVALLAVPDNWRERASSNVIMENIGGSARQEAILQLIGNTLDLAVDVSQGLSNTINRNIGGHINNGYDIVEPLLA